jgi:hypothetical protein
LSLRIFDGAEKPSKGKFADDLVGRFRAGYVTPNGKPASVTAWRITTGDPDVAQTLAELYGGEPQEWTPGSAKAEDIIEVFTETASIEVILDGHSAIRSEMVLFGPAGPIRKCDGVEQKGTEPGDPDTGAACACPGALDDRKKAAEKGKGCKPSVTIYFRLADAPDLGKFRFQSSSWILAADIAKAEAALDRIDGPARATLTLVQVETSQRKFTKTVVEVLGAVK